MKVKLCGFTDEKSVDAAIAAKCDFLGFVFCDRSVRKVLPQKAAEISSRVPVSISKVAVVADPDFSLLTEIHKTFFPDFFQFHGSETPEFLQKVRDEFPQIKIIKAFRIAETRVCLQTNCLESQVILPEFRARISEEYTTIPKKFSEESQAKEPRSEASKASESFSLETGSSDLNQIKNFVDVADFFLFDGKSAGSGMKFDWTILQNFSCEKEWFLSGGLNIGNVEGAVKLTGAKMIDVSSGIEKIRGQKSQELIAEFMNKIRNYVS